MSTHIHTHIHTRRQEAVVREVSLGEKNFRLTYNRNKKIPMPTQLGTHLLDTGTAPTGSCPWWGMGLQSRSHLPQPGMLAAPDTGLGDRNSMGEKRMYTEQSTTDMLPYPLIY